MECPGRHRIYASTPLALMFRPRCRSIMTLPFLQSPCHVRCAGGGIVVNPRGRRLLFCLIPTGSETGDSVQALHTSVVSLACVNGGHHTLLAPRSSSFCIQSANSIPSDGDGVDGSKHSPKLSKCSQTPPEQRLVRLSLLLASVIIQATVVLVPLMCGLSIPSSVHAVFVRAVVSCQQVYRSWRR